MWNRNSMQLYDSKHNMWIWNWILYSETKDSSYFHKKGKKLTKKQEKQAEINYIEIMKTMKHVSSKLYENYVIWMLLLTQHRANMANKRIDKIIGDNKDYVVKELEAIFKDYISEIDRGYKNFIFTEHYFNPDYKEEIAKMMVELGNPKGSELVAELIDEFKDIKFYTWDEYAFFLLQYEINFLFINPEFKKRFILEREIKIDSIKLMDDYLLDVYSKFGYYDQYQFVRKAMFDINTMNCEPKERRSQLDEIASISKIIGIQINPRKTTISEYESYQEMAQQIAERSKEDPKPQANGIN